MIIGHNKQKEFFKKMISSGNVPHALLFSGQECLGKKTMALEFIASVFQEEKDLSSHPDFTLVSPLSGQIKIKQIRDLNWKLSLKPVKADYLGAVVDQAHLMTRAAQNCFLKTLEEPKAQSILILVTEHPEILLPTILSRCEHIKFYPVEEDKMITFLEEKRVPSGRIKDIVEIAGGRPGKAVKLIESPEALLERKQKIEKLISILRAPLSFRFQYAKELAEQSDIKETLAIWTSYFRKKLLDPQSASLIRSKNVLKEIQKIIFLLSTTNINTKLALETLMIHL